MRRNCLTTLASKAMPACEIINANVREGLAQRIQEIMGKPSLVSGKRIKMFSVQVQRNERIQDELLVKIDYRIDVLFFPSFLRKDF